MCQLFIRPHPFAPFMVPLQPLVYSPMRDGVINRCASPPHTQGSWFLQIIPCSDMFPRPTCVSTSSCPTMCSSVMLSCGGISLLSRGVVRGGCVAGMPPKPSASPVLPVTSSSLLCLWRMKIWKKTSCLTLLLNWTKSDGRGSREDHTLAFN